MFVYLHCCVCVKVSHAVIDQIMMYNWQKKILNLLLPKQALTGFADKLYES